MSGTAEVAVVDDVWKVSPAVVQPRQRGWEI